MQVSSLNLKLESQLFALTRSIGSVEYIGFPAPEIMGNWDLWLAKYLVLGISDCPEESVQLQFGSR